MVKKTLAIFATGTIVILTMIAFMPVISAIEDNEGDCIPDECHLLPIPHDKYIILRSQIKDVGLRSDKDVHPPITAIGKEG